MPRGKGHLRGQSQTHSPMLMARLWVEGLRIAVDATNVNLIASQSHSGSHRFPRGLEVSTAGGSEVWWRPTINDNFPAGICLTSDQLVEELAWLPLGPTPVPLEK